MEPPGHWDQALVSARAGDRPVPLGSSPPITLCWIRSLFYGGGGSPGDCTQLPKGLFGPQSAHSPGTRQARVCRAGPLGRGGWGWGRRCGHRCAGWGGHTARLRLGLRRRDHPRPHQRREAACLDSGGCWHREARGATTRSRPWPAPTLDPREADPGWTCQPGQVRARRQPVGAGPARAGGGPEGLGVCSTRRQEATATREARGHRAIPWGAQPPREGPAASAQRGRGVGAPRCQEGSGLLTLRPALCPPGPPGTPPLPGGWGQRRGGHRSGRSVPGKHPGAGTLSRGCLGWGQVQGPGVFANIPMEGRRSAAFPEGATQPGQGDKSP